MSEEFIPETSETPNPQALSNVFTEPSPNRERIKVMVIGSHQGVANTIQSLYSRGFAQISEWSPLLPGPNPGEVMRILTRQLNLQ
jgi:hypothetical protein